MNIFRKIIASFILLLIGMPVLFGIIWAVGLTKAATSEKLLSDFPAQVIENIPSMTDETLAALEKSNIDDDAKIWLRAIRESDFSMKKYMEESGIMKWLKEEAGTTLKKISDIANSKIEMQDAGLNMIPLKEAIRSNVNEKYFRKILEKLPECREDQKNLWAEFMNSRESCGELPACRPGDIDNVVNRFRSERIKNIDEIPDFVPFTQGADEIDPVIRGLRLTKGLDVFYFLLFLIPAIIIASGSWIAGGGLQQFLKWAGAWTAGGGVITYAFTKSVTGIFPFVTELPGAAYNFSEGNLYVRTAFVEKLNDIITLFFKTLFDPVSEIAGGVIIVGVVLFAISFAVQGRDQKQLNK